MRKARITAGTRTRSAAMVATLAVAVACPPRAVQAADPLEPAWVWRKGGEPVWAASVGTAEVSSIVVATRAGTLQLLDSVTGHARLAAPVQASPGVQLAASAGPAAASDVVVCVDRFALHALDVGAKPRLRWRHGSVPARIESFPGDPEVLAGWSNAAATDAGVLALNRDGTLVILSTADGQVRGTHTLTPPALAEIFARGAAAVVLWKHGDAVHAAFVDLAGDPPPVRQRPLGMPWPLLAGLAPEGLVCVTGGEVAVYREDGEPRRFAPNARLRAATVDLGVLPGNGARAAGPPADSEHAGVLLVARGVRPAAYSLAARKRLWPRDGASAFGADVQTLRAVGPAYLATTGWGAFVGRLADGGVLAASFGPPHELLDAHVTDTVLYALYKDAAEAGRLRLHRVPLRDPDRPPSADLPATAPASSAADGTWFTLASSAGVRQAVWSRHHVALLLPDRIVAYKLP